MHRVETTRVDRPSTNTPIFTATPEGEAYLVERIAAGDKHAFESLYRAYVPRLARFLRRMTRSPGAIEEIANDTLLAVWQNAAAFNGGSKVSTWIFAIARRRACKVLGAADVPLDADAGERECADADRPEWQLEQLRLAQAVDAALATLPFAQRTAFRLAFYHDMGCDEIAGVVDCPVNTVKTRLFHARKRLAKLLGGDEVRQPGQVSAGIFLSRS
jgi:RNA polymerase sigma factor (sigma-70 family)